ncbi:hypothetical protein LOC68_24975 [Blastopirellula sp. JC732]|uniref:Uncharacterized protein n=1 Tax=Blastopirellula sediminis TaxID=2894196 RepID=A0A9X1SII8_9BACT|nr:hypothetical protein [Blastopirellula sediminis]MCC9605037.1 hypothetical protein [Blastopirellula sediminis]MCC9631663.1 hypothetical protein [Blastopirellula sediminis]
MSNAPHSIRLNGPWQAYLAPGADPTRLHLPRDWSSIPLETCDTGLKLTRFFNAPTGLAADDEVVLVLDAIPISGRVTLNGQMLGVSPGSERFDITTQLAPRNELEIAGLLLEAGDQVGEVRLEIFAR